MLTADHGEAFGEHGEESHSLFVYDTTLRVPLLVRGPGWPPARRAAGAGRARRPRRDPPRRSAGAPRALPGAAASALEGAPPSPSTRRRWRRASTSAGATCARGATGATSTSARRGRSCTTWRRIPRETRDLAAAQPATSSRGSRGALDALLVGGGGEAREPPRPSTPRRRSGCARSATCRAPAARGTGADPKDKVEVALAHRARRRPLRDHAEAVAAYRRDRRPRPRRPAREPPPRRRAAARGPRRARRSRTSRR